MIINLSSFFYEFSSLTSSSILSDAELASGVVDGVIGPLGLVNPWAGYQVLKKMLKRVNINLSIMCFFYFINELSAFLYLFYISYERFAWLCSGKGEVGKFGKKFTMHIFGYA